MPDGLTTADSFRARFYELYDLAVPVLIDRAPAAAVRAVNFGTISVGPHDDGSAAIRAALAMLPRGESVDRWHVEQIAPSWEIQRQVWYTPIFGHRMERDVRVITAANYRVVAYLRDRTDDA